MKDRTISIILKDTAGFQETFESLRGLYEFAKGEYEFWETKHGAIAEKGNVNDAVLNSRAQLLKIVKEIDGWQEQIENWDENQFRQKIQALQQSTIQQMNSRWLWSGHPFTETFSTCFLEHNQATAQAFLNFVTKKQVSVNQNNIDAFTGAMLGYEFVNQKSEITRRRNGEKVSLGRLRNQFADTKNTLFSEIAQTQSEVEGWQTDTKTKFERLYSANKYLGERRIKGQNKKFDDHLRTWSSTVEELEKTYEEKLKLQKPADYWSKAAKRYGTQGSLWSLAIVALVVVGLVYFHGFFTTWLQGKEIGVKLHTIQGVILFGSLAAVYAYLMKVLSRLAFSAFHLMRDAEEREQLTYLYLSLSNESEIDEKSRDIVLQALFSRSETGLLAQEHGPTMPGIADALKAISKGK